MKHAPAVCTLFLAFILTAASAFADLRFDPPNPTPHTSVDAVFSGGWPDGCGPVSRSVAVAGQTITVHLVGSTRPCPAVVIPFDVRVHLGLLAAGTYTIVVVRDFGESSQPLARATLIVRDDETITMIPYAVPITGGLITFTNAAPGVLTIDGVNVPMQLGGDIPPRAQAPPHAPGAVDVTVNRGDGVVVTAKAALIYYDPAAIDPTVFEPILFPVSFEGPGALGSRWLTENFIYAGYPAFFRDAVPCAHCSQTLPAISQQLTNNGNPWGHVLYAMRGSSLDASSRIRDTSRQAETAGTEVPVVRESDFRRQLHFLNVPVDPRYRVMLRLWSMNNDGARFAALVDLTTAQQTFTVSTIPGTSMTFGSIDVTALLTSARFRPTGLTIAASSGLSGSPSIWGMLSITNNETQQVTIVTPH